MSQAQLPAGMGRCNVCKQAQLYTNQVCDICQSRLPWAVAPPVAPLPATIPLGPQPAPIAEPRNTWKLVLGIVGGMVLLIAVATTVLLTILGNNLKNTFDTARQPPPNGQAVAINPNPSNPSNQSVSPNQPAVPNQAVVSNQNSLAGCGAFTAQECEWHRDFGKAIRVIDMDQLKGESRYQYFDRMSRTAFLIKSNLYDLRPVPALFQEIHDLTLRAMDEWDAANQAGKKAEEIRSLPLAEEAIAGMRTAANTLREVGQKMDAIEKTYLPNP